MDKINNKNTIFNQVQKGKPKVYSDKEKTDILVSKSRQILAQKTEKEVPENGQFRKIFVAFDVPNTQNEAVLSIEHDLKNPKIQRRLFIGVHHQNRDRLFSNMLLRGTKQEIIDYLNSEDNQELVKTLTAHLSDKVDEYYSSL